MDHAMTYTDSIWRRCQVAAARVHVSIGWSGLAGLALLLTAFAVGLVHHVDALHPEHNSAPEIVPRAIPAVGLPEADTQGAVLPRLAELPLLLTQLEYAALAQHLGWHQGQYRLIPTTAELPALVEVRLTLNGPYPRVRQFLGTVLHDLPNLGIKAFSIGRATSDLAEVEAQMSLVLFVKDTGSQGDNPAESATDLKAPSAAPGSKQGEAL
jgi:hypothetical protein